MNKFNWKKYLKSRPDLKKNWNGPIRAWIHYHIVLKIELIKFKIISNFHRLIWEIRANSRKPMLILKYGKKNKKILEDLINLLIKSENEIYIKNNQPIPEIFYIGDGKSGSQSIIKNVNKTAAHWHSEKYFEEIYDTDLLSNNNICLYDLVLYIGKKYNLKPLIIESYREPISRVISLISQDIHMGKEKVNHFSEYISIINNSLNNRIMFNPYSLKWNNYFGTDLITNFDTNKNYYYKELKNVKLLFLKLEDSKNWPSIFKSLGYKYKDKQINTSRERSFYPLYKEVLDEFRLPKNELNKIYGHKIIKILYSEKEIRNFKKKWEETN